MKRNRSRTQGGTRVSQALAFVVFMAAAMAAHAHHGTPNTAFQGGEVLEYKLYFNWKFVWVSAGTARLETRDARWEGVDAYRSSLLTSTSKRLDHYFQMRDTLQCVLSKDMRPLYYKKAANEGGKYYVDQVWYSYPQGGGVSLRQQYLNRRGETSRTSHSGTKPVYDMMSIMLCARSQDGSKLRKGDRLVYPMADGRGVEDITLVYRGKKNFRMRNTGVTYRCLIFSFVEYKGKKEKEVITFYITDDANHMPVRLDMFLRFGVAKAYLSRATGLRNDCKSIVRED